MSSSENLRAVGLEIRATHLIVELEDGSRHAALIDLFPILADATPEERSRWILAGAGTGFHWPDIDEDISVYSIVHPEQTVSMNGPAVHELIRRNRQRRSSRTA
jgi:hypothetical protein